jgi:hypothetical protein
MPEGVVVIATVNDRLESAITMPSETRRSRASRTGIVLTPTLSAID